MRLFLAGATVLILVHPLAYAGTPVYKCVKDGITVLTDKPCTDANDSSAQPPSTVPSSSTPSPVGKWSGQMQYHAVENGHTLSDAHSVALLTAEFTPDGKVTGASNENGCAALGVWSAGPTPTLFWLDITLSGCRADDLNQRYNGSFILAKPDRSGQVQLQAIELPSAGHGGRMQDVKGTLRR